MSYHVVPRPVQFWLAAHAGASVRRMFAHHVGFHFELFGVVPAGTHRFSVDGIPGVAYESSPFGAALEFGPELEF